MYIYKNVMRNLKYGTNELIYKTERLNRHREETCGCQGEGRRGGKNWEYMISRCKLLYIGWINNKVVLYRTGDYIQYPRINCNR